MASPYQNIDAVSAYNPSVLKGVGTTFIILPAAIVALRFWVRHRSQANVWLDDWMIVFALVLNTISGIALLLDTTLGGLGSHQQLGPEGQLVHTSQLTAHEKTRFTNQVVSTFNLGIIKISVLLFYRRLFAVKQFEIANTVVLAIVGAWTIAMTSATLGQCTPPSIIWEKLKPEQLAYCIDSFMLFSAVAYSDLILDILVLMLPVPWVLMLHMPWKKKIAVLDILLLTAVVLGSGIIRVVAYQDVIGQFNNNRMGYVFDATWWSAAPLFWNFAETTVAVIGACLPTLAPLWQNSCCGSRRKERLTVGISGWTGQSNSTSRSNPYVGRHSTSSSQLDTLPKGRSSLDYGSKDPIFGEDSRFTTAPSTRTQAKVFAGGMPLTSRPAGDSIRVERSFSTDMV